MKVEPVTKPTEKTALPEFASLKGQNPARINISSLSQLENQYPDLYKALMEGQMSSYLLREQSAQTARKRRMASYKRDN